MNSDKVANELLAVKRMDKHSKKTGNGVEDIRFSTSAEHGVYSRSQTWYPDGICRLLLII